MNPIDHLTNEVHYSGASQVLASYQYTVASDGTRLASTETRLESGGSYSTTQIAWTNDALHRLVREASGSTVAALNFTNSYVYDLAVNGSVLTIDSWLCGQGGRFVACAELPGGARLEISDERVGFQRALVC